VLTFLEDFGQKYNGPTKGSNLAIRANESPAKAPFKLSGSQEKSQVIYSKKKPSMSPPK